MIAETVQVQTRNRSRHNARMADNPSSASPMTEGAIAALKLYVDLVNSERQAIWTRHATMLVGNSILINAAAGDLGSRTSICLSFLGLFLCVLWGIITWDGWYWFYKGMEDAKKLPVDPALNPFSSILSLTDRHADKIFKCTMAVIVIFGLVYLSELLGPFYKA